GFALTKPLQTGRSSILNLTPAGSTRNHRFVFPIKVLVPGKWKSFGHEESSIGVSDRSHHGCHCLGNIITSSSVAGRFGWVARGRTDCWRGDRWHSIQRLCVWPRLQLLGGYAPGYYPGAGYGYYRYRGCPEPGYGEYYNCGVYAVRGYGGYAPAYYGYGLGPW